MVDIKIVNDTTAPAILVDVDGRVLAKCPKCTREYHLDEHAPCQIIAALSPKQLTLLAEMVAKFLPT